MLASELIEQLKVLIEAHGDQSVFVDCGLDAGGLAPVTVVDLDADDIGFIIWPVDDEKFIPGCCLEDVASDDHP